MYRVTPPNGFHLSFPNGWTVSVQWGAAIHGDNYDSRDFDTPMTSTTAEIAIFPTGGSGGVGEPQGYVSPTTLVALLVEVAARPIPDAYIAAIVLAGGENEWK